MAAIAATIIERRSGAFDPASVRDSHQDALRDLTGRRQKAC
jgi:non-homologous end joining protein Ku